MFGVADLDGVVEAMERIAAGFDPAVVSAGEAGSVALRAATVEKLAATVKALAAARAADVAVGPGASERDVAERLARRSGVSLGAARAAIETGRRLCHQAELAAAARRGEVSAVQAAAIARAVAANPGAEGRLVALAAASSVADLITECDRARAAADADAAGRHRRIHRQRFARRTTCADGAGEIRYRATVEQVASVWSVIEGYARAAFDRARLEGRHEPAEAYLADGVADMALAAAGAGGGVGVGAGEASLWAAAGPGDAGAAGSPVAAGRRVRRAVPTKVIFRVDWSAYVRGHPGDGEVCEVAGVGSVPVEVIDDIVASGDAVLAAVVTRGVDVVNVAHLGRRPSAHQLTGLEWRGRQCAVTGCTGRGRLEIDHRVDWRFTRHTRLQELEWHCGHHHDLKSRHGWALVEGRGTRDMVPPGDPRHPGRAGGGGGDGGAGGGSRPPPVGRP